MNNYISHPVQAISGDMCVSGDKSISHRALIFGAIARGKTTVHGFLSSKDCLATLRALQAMSVSIEQTTDHIVIHGVGKYGLSKPAQVLDCGNSGTSMRLLAGLLAAQVFDSELTGDASLLGRPMERICRPLHKMGADVFSRDGKPPLTIRGGQTLHGITYEIPEASAQVKSCILLAGLYAEGETHIVETSLTRDHTERMLATFSYPVHKLANTLMITAQHECLATEITIPGDISSAAFFIVAACIIPQSELVIRNVGVNPTRMGIIHILQRMGACIELRNKRLYGEEPVADIHVQYASLEGIDIPNNWVPIAIDEFPIIFIAAACAKGNTSLHGAEELRYKESDRIQAMVEGLTTLGIQALALDDGIVIQGGQFSGGIVDSHYDHRVAMAFTIAGAVAKAPVTILHCENIATSFPSFLTLAKQVNLNIESNNE